MRKSSSSHHLILRLTPSLAAAAIALGISSVLPMLGPLLLALLIGASVANSQAVVERLPGGQASVTKTLLRLGIVLIGLRLPLDDILGVGIAGFVIVTVTVLVTYAATTALGSRLELDPRLVTLLAAGFSICGAAAIAAIDDAVKAREKDVALAVAMVTLFGSAMIALVPWVSGLAGLSTEQAGVWAGASIHEVAQVVAAASIVGGGALALATTIKLGRVMLLAPVYSWTARGARRDDGARISPLPWFVVAFMVAVGLRSTGILPEQVLTVTGHAATALLAAGMFGLGLGFRFKDLWPVPWAAFGLATVSTAVAGGVSLALVLLLM